LTPSSSLSTSMAPLLSKSARDSVYAVTWDWASRVAVRGLWRRMRGGCKVTQG
jgi:hypothetical protein